MKLQKKARKGNAHIRQIRWCQHHFYAAHMLDIVYIFEQSLHFSIVASGSSKRCIYSNNSISLAKAGSDVDLGFASNRVHGKYITE